MSDPARKQDEKVESAMRHLSPPPFPPTLSLASVFGAHNYKAEAESTMTHEAGWKQSDEALACMSHRCGARAGHCAAGRKGEAVKRRGGAPQAHFSALVGRPARQPLASREICRGAPGASACRQCARVRVCACACAHRVRGRQPTRAFLSGGPLLRAGLSKSVEGAHEDARHSNRLGAPNRPDRESCPSVVEAGRHSRHHCAEQRAASADSTCAQGRTLRTRRPRHSRALREAQQRKTHFLDAH